MLRVWDDDGMTDSRLPVLVETDVLEAELVDDDSESQLPQIRTLNRQSEQVRAAFLLGFTNPNTQAAYRRDLDQWFAFCSSYGLPPLAARRLHVDAYVRWMIENPPHSGRRPDPAAPHRPATIARKVSAVRGFYAYAVDEELLQRNPVPGHKRLNLPKVSRKSQTLGPDKEEASRLLAAIEAVSPGNRLLQGPALAGLVGDQALPFLEYREMLNLPDPEDILKDPRRFVLPDRVDRAYAICYSLAGAVINHKTPERWEAAMIALGVACRKNADIPTAAARTLCDKRNRPDGLNKLPDECRPFYELMQMAKLVPRE